MRELRRQVKQHVEGLRAFGVTHVPGPAKAASKAATSSAASPAAAPSTDKVAQLSRLAEEVARCRACTLYRTRTHPVFSDGSPDAQLVFVGEAPGRDEDLQGKPFVGAAGQLLTKMIQAMGLRREDVYICNVLKDRPPNNRVPLPEEVEACRPFLERQIDLIAPKVICTLGAVATKALLGPHIAITQVRGQRHEYRGIPLIPTFHPAYLLRNPPAKKYAWIDLKIVKSFL